MTRELDRLSTFDDDGALRVVVESPRGSATKYEFDPELGTFSVTRELPLGVTYPFDWGFIPGTLGADGDPLDAMVLHSHPSYPGIVLPCRILGMVELVQREGNSKRITNNRVIATPSWHQALVALEEARDLPKDIKAEIIQFFVSAVRFTGKDVVVKGWASSRKTRAFIKHSVAQ